MLDLLNTQFMKKQIITIIFIILILAVSGAVLWYFTKQSDKLIVQNNKEQKVK